jgi:WD40 repeat protein
LNTVISDNGSRLAVFGRNTIQVWDLPSARPRAFLGGYGAPQVNLMFSPDGGLLLGQGGSYGELRIWDIKTRQENFRVLSNWLPMTFSPDSKGIATPNSIGGVHVLDVKSGSELYSFTASGETVRAMLFSTNNRFLALTTWRDEPGRLVQTVYLLRLDNMQTLLRIPFTHSPAFSADGNLIAVAGYLDEQVTVRIFDTSTGTELVPIRKPLESKWPSTGSLAFSPDGSFIAIGNGHSSDLRTALWDMKPRRLYGYVKGIRPVFSPDGRVFQTDDERTLYLWDAETFQEKYAFPDTSSFFRFSIGGYAPSFSSDSKFLITRSGRDAATLYDVATGQPKLILKGCKQSMTADIGVLHNLIVSPDRTLLAFSSDDGTIRLWAIE